VQSLRKHVTGYVNITYNTNTTSSASATLHKEYAIFIIIIIFFHIRQNSFVKRKRERNPILLLYPLFQLCFFLGK
jgi:hypothetical protein